jgi:cytochrome P450
MRPLHSHEIVGNIFLFMVAGYETTSTSLASCTYVLATRPDIQSRLFAEIEAQQWNGSDNANDESFSNLTYMDMFVREVLRMFPVVTQAMVRMCNATSTVCGYTIEKGLHFICCR